MPKKVYVFERNCCGPSPSADLVSFLQRKFQDHIEVKVFDLGKPNSLLPIPTQLLLKIQTEGGDCLPAMVVDGVLVAERKLPNFLEAVEIVQTGQPTAISLVPASSATETKRCCS